jgi:hypothetical protein
MKNYNYNAINKLLLYFDTPIQSFDKVNICAYKVTTYSKNPFLNILLFKEKTTNVLQLPKIQIFKEFSNEEIINYSKITLFALCMINTDYDDFSNTILFNGFYIVNNNLYLFFDITPCSIKINDIYSNSALWFAIIDEVLNHKKICNLMIEKEVTEFFTLNEDFCFLQDDYNDNYETPIVGFIGTTKDQVSFKYTFGESIKNKNGVLGPYFYFTNFINSYTTEEDKINDCIIRFALFLGNTKYIENKPNDPIDESEIKKERLLDTNIDQNIEKLTMKISDHDGLWSKTYDSAYIGNIELENGTNMTNVPIIVLKIYEQQTSLSHHYINRKKLPENYEIL